MALEQLRTIIRNELGSIIKDAGYGELTENIPLVIGDKSKNQGDFASSVVLKSSKLIQDSPMKVAESIVSYFEKNTSEYTFVEQLSVAAPGFLNITLSDSRLFGYGEELFQNLDSCGKNTVLAGQKIIVEYTDPNPFKEMHIGHFLPNIVGESIARMMELSGAEVKRANYQGDVGKHVAKAVWGLQHLMADESVSVDDLESKSLQERAAFLGRAYAAGASLFEEDESVKEEIESLNQVIYEKNDEKVNELYTHGRQWSLDYFETMYTRLETAFDYYFFESQVGESGAAMVKENIGEVFEESDGAVIFPGEKHGLHNRVFINSLGLPTYESKDMYLGQLKYDNYAYDKSFIVTANEIDDYFKVVLKALSFVRPDLAEKTTHISHGFLQLKGRKMSSRTGDVVTAEWLLNTIRDEVLEKSAEASEKKVDLTPETADKIALAAIKYTFLKSNVGNDVVFDLEESIALDGDTGPYLQYVYARTQSILDTVGNISVSSYRPFSQFERELLLQVAQVSQVIQDASMQLAPHIIATYAIELAQTFNRFYNEEKILSGDDKQEMRVMLTKLVAVSIERCLYALGIPVLQRM